MEKKECFLPLMVILVPAEASLGEMPVTTGGGPILRSNEASIGFDSRTMYLDFIFKFC